MSYLKTYNEEFSCMQNLFILFFNLLGNKVSECSKLKSIVLPKFNEGLDFYIKLDMINFFFF